MSNAAGSTGEVEFKDGADGPFLGGIPTARIDIPVSIVFLIIFMGTAGRSLYIFITNQKRKHRFFFNLLIFDFCLDRVLSCVFRILWAAKGQRGFGLVQEVCENGTQLVLITNIFFFQRVIRAMHPQVGWSSWFRIFSRTLIITTICNVVANIVALFFVFLSPGNARQIDGAEEVVRITNCINLTLSVVPVICEFIACAFPGPEPENFGTGPFRSKFALLAFGHLCLTIGASFRTATSLHPEAGRMGSPLFSRAAFYTTSWMLELSVIATYLYFRVDRLFHIPNGSKAPGDYSAGSKEKFGSNDRDREFDYNLGMFKRDDSSSSNFSGD